jgi:hypothetical protein
VVRIGHGGDEGGSRQPPNAGNGLYPLTHRMRLRPAWSVSVSYATRLETV